MMRKRTGGPVVVITGASAGVGRAVARAFARQGARIGLVARGEDGLDATAREVEALGGRALVLPADVADAAAVEDVAAAVEAAFGPIDVWVNNAMAAVFAPVAALTAAEARRVTEVTYLGYVHGTLAALARMRPRGRGTIVQVGSALAYRSIPLQAAYCGAKAAIRGFTDALRSELIHDRCGVRVTMVQLPAVNTPQFGWAPSRMPGAPQPLPPIFQPEVAAEAIAWAARHPRREVWVGLPTFQAILAQRLAPGLLDRILARRGYRGQQRARPADPARPTNLWRPVPGDHGAHGAFDREAYGGSAALWLVERQRALTLAAGALALAALGRWAYRGAVGR